MVGVNPAVNHGHLNFVVIIRFRTELHRLRLLRENPTEETGTYIHPKIGVAEHVFTEEEIKKTLEKDFTIHKIIKSHRHKNKGKAFKRRSISIYAERNF